MPTHPQPGTILLAGANRGLGLGLAEAYAGQGWQVIATARSPEHATELERLRAGSQGRVTVEQLDVADPASVTALATRLGGHRLDVLFVVAGIGSKHANAVREVAHEEVARMFVTNATAPIALAESLQDRLAPNATVVFMTSLMGSIASNAGGGMEMYRASKAALNMLASCYALRQKSHPVLLLHPGWVRTDMGGDNAPLDIPTSVAGMLDVVAGRAGKPGVAYLDYQGHKLPW